MQIDNQPLESALEHYEASQKNIRRLLAQIESGLIIHDINASKRGMHHWGHVGDLIDIEAQLQQIKDRLHLTGEYKGR